MSSTPLTRAPRLIGNVDLMCVAFISCNTTLYATQGTRVAQLYFCEPHLTLFENHLEVAHRLDRSLQRTTRA